MPNFNKNEAVLTFAEKKNSNLTASGSRARADRRPSETMVPANDLAIDDQLQLVFGSKEARTISMGPAISPRSWTTEEGPST